jgi:hypothetical protein
MLRAEMIAFSPELLVIGTFSQSIRAAIPTLAVIKHFRAEIEEHIRRKGCPLALGEEQAILADHCRVGVS